MNPYITFRDADKNGKLQYYILQREFPHYVGLLTPYPLDNVIIQVPVSGFNLWVSFSGTIRGNVLPSYNNLEKELSDVFRRMADWYLVNRINTNSKKYKKFKL